MSDDKIKVIVDAVDDPIRQVYSAWQRGARRIDAIDDATPDPKTLIDECFADVVRAIERIPVLEVREWFMSDFNESMVCGAHDREVHRAKFRKFFRAFLEAQL